MNSRITKHTGPEWDKLLAASSQFPRDYERPSNRSTLTMRWFDPRVDGPKRLCEILRRLRAHKRWLDLLEGFPYTTEVPNDLRGVSLFPSPDELRRVDINWLCLDQALSETDNSDWSEMTHIHNLDDVELASADLSFSHAWLVSMERVNLQLANLTGVDFSECRFASANLQTAILEGAKLVKTYLPQANMRAVKARHANLEGATLCEADLSLAVLTGANLKEANLTNAVLHNVVLDDANLDGANLLMADALRAKLVRTSMKGANLKLARFDRAIIRNVDISGSHIFGAHFRAAEVIEDFVHERCTFEAPGKQTGHTPPDFFEPYPNVPVVFLSYARADMNPVLGVDQWLRYRGARVLLDERDFIPGRGLLEEIVHRIKQSGVVVCFVSAASKERPYVKLERAIAETMRAKNEVQVIYFNLDSTVLDPIHESRLYIPGHELLFEEACERLWQGIVQVGRPAAPIDIEPLRRAGIGWTKIGRNSSEQT